MGLFDTLAREATQALSGSAASAHPGMIDAVTSMIRDSAGGGLSGLIAKFQQGGLGDAVASWVGTGKNLPITPDQLQSVLGNAQVQAIAQKFGLSTDDVAHALANLLPQAIDHLTPNGQVPSSSVMEQGLAILRGLGTRS